MRCNKFEQASYYDRDVRPHAGLPEDPIAENSKKAGFHRSMLMAEERGRKLKTVQVTYLDTPANPFATFTFCYQPREILQAKGLMPLDPPRIESSSASDDPSKSRKRPASPVTESMAGPSRRTRLGESPPRNKIGAQPSSSNLSVEREPNQEDVEHVKREPNQEDVKPIVPALNAHDQLLNLSQQMQTMQQQMAQLQAQIIQAVAATVPRATGTAPHPSETTGKWSTSLWMTDYSQ